MQMELVVGAAVTIKGSSQAKPEKKHHHYYSLNFSYSEKQQALFSDLCVCIFGDSEASLVFGILLPAVIAIIRGAKSIQG